MNYRGVSMGDGVSFSSGARIEGVQKNLTRASARADAPGLLRQGVSEVLLQSKMR